MASPCSADCVKLMVHRRETADSAMGSPEVSEAEACVPSWKFLVAQYHSLSLAQRLVIVWGLRFSGNAVDLGLRLLLSGCAKVAGNQKTLRAD